MPTYQVANVKWDEFKQKYPKLLSGVLDAEGRLISFTTSDSLTDGEIASLEALIERRLIKLGEA